MVRRHRDSAVPPETSQDPEENRPAVAGETETHAAIPEPPEARRIHLLVVDRDPRITSACRALLESNGFDIEAADSIAGALKAFETRTYDVALVELSLPDGTGFDLLRELRHASPTTIPIVTSAYSTVRNAVEAVKRGAYDYLVKPFSDDVLVESLADALEKRAFFGTARPCR